ncbi:MAG TPA: hypothetical protein VFQ72_01125 [Candidatus Paceibacterota bacterium]|nr:hypothetical protein [Candidatus Paceibacterota bacterium]
MKNYQGDFIAPTVIGLIILIAVGGGIYFVQKKKVQPITEGTNNVSGLTTYKNEQYDFEISYDSSKHSIKAEGDKIVGYTDYDLIFNESNKRGFEESHTLYAFPKEVAETIDNAIKRVILTSEHNPKDVCRALPLSEMGDYTRRYIDCGDTETEYKNYEKLPTYYVGRSPSAYFLYNPSYPHVFFYAVGDQVSDNFLLTGLKFTGASNVPSIKVTSPNGGETWKMSEQKSIVWTSSNLPSNAKVGIRLRSEKDFSYFCDPVGAEVLAKQGSFAITPATTVCVGITSSRPEDRFKLTAGRYKVELGATNYGGGKGLMDSSDNYFTITN